MTSKQPSNSYMGSGLAHTLDPKQTKNTANGLQGLGSGLQGTVSATSLTLSNYAVPSLDGRLIPAVPKSLALKFKPPTVAVVYTMKDTKSGRHKKYIHEIKINFEKQNQNKTNQLSDGSLDINKLCDEICRKEQTYLNPQFIARQQVLELLTKLYKNYSINKENKAPTETKAKAPEPVKEPEIQKVQEPERKQNFFERKRFIDYERNESDSEQENKKASTEAPAPQREKKSIVMAEESVGADSQENEEEVISKQPAKKGPSEVKASAPKPAQTTVVQPLAPVIQAPAPIVQAPAPVIVQAPAPTIEKPSSAKAVVPEQKDPKLEKKETSEYSEWDLEEMQLEEKKGAAAEPASKAQEKPFDFFNPQEKVLEINEIQLDDLENEFNHVAMPDRKKGANPFGQSITKELLQQSKKEIAKDLQDFDENESEQSQGNQFKDKFQDSKLRKNLKIEIDENVDYDQANEDAQQLLIDNMNQKDRRTTDIVQQFDDYEQRQAQEDEDEEIEVEEVNRQFEEIYQNDPELRQLLGAYPERYLAEERLSIVQAYKKGGGVAGLADIIEEDDGQVAEVGQGNGQDDEEEEEMDIDLENPNDVKIIEEEFMKLYQQDEQFRTNFGEEAFELEPIQKYQIIDAYNKNGMEAVLALLTTSADQSAIMQQMDGQQQIGAGDESVVIHNGKRYNRIQIDGVGDDDEYLMDENGDIYTQDFKFITNMGENMVIDE